MTIRITGSAFASSALEVIILKTLHMFEAPLLLVGAFKYITKHFPVKFSATIYLIAFCFAKQLSIMFMSTFAGLMYMRIDFHGTYLVLGSIAFVFTVISAFTLSGRGPLSLFKKPEQSNSLESSSEE